MTLRGASLRLDPEQIISAASEPVARLPMLIKGRLVLADQLATPAAETTQEGDPGVVVLDDAYVLRQFVGGERRLTLLPRPSPGDLIEANPGELVRSLYSLSSPDVYDYVGALRDVVRREATLIERLAATAKGRSPVADFALDVFAAGLADLLDPHALALAVDRELGDELATGRDYLDGWVAIPAAPRAGPTARLATRLFGDEHAPPSPAARVRAMPTRQLHITSGTSPVIPFISALRAFATKSAAVIKSPAESMIAATILAVAMSTVDPDHPLTRHTSLTYWPGGDAAIEDRLFAPDAFDRVVVWGSQATVDSVHQRVRSTRTVFMTPRVGVSVIGRAAHEGRLRQVAARAASDSMVLDQQGCMSSLVHYVEGSEDDVLAYCQALRDALSQWDDALPALADRDRVAALRRLRRGHFIEGRWFENTARPTTGSVVIYLPHGFDLAVHPMTRVVVVRPLATAADAVRHIGRDVSTVGVFPESLRQQLRDDLAARGVSHIVPLGQCERSFAGMPHDGMRIMNELVNWVSA